LARAKRVRRAQKCLKKGSGTARFERKNSEQASLDELGSKTVKTARVLMVCELREALFERFCALILADFA
jgi:hypothetical protein